jgi:3-oxoacyl-[acyl-carrier-protein] synthase II
MSQNKRRVVITGMGTVNSVGLNVKDYWEGLKTGKSGLSRVTNIDLLDSPSQVAGEIKNDVFNPENYMERKLVKRMARYCHFAMAASKEAMEDSGLINANIDKERAGVIIGSGIGGIEIFYEQSVKLHEQGHNRVSPLLIPMLISDIATGYVSIQYGYRGPNYAAVSACASGGHAMVNAFNHIVNDDADIIISGGAEATITKIGFGGFTQAMALSTHYNDTPQKASRPFDKDRDGFVMGEGAGILILEELEHAKKRGAKIYAEILSYGVSGDAHHITAPCPDGSGAALAMKNAIRKAGIKNEDIQLVNAHGTSTGLGDIAETMATKSVFGEHAYKLKVNSTKSMTGHCLGAAAGIEAIACVMMIRDGVIHPTINLDNPDPECDLNYVPNKAIQQDISYAISNSFGFGGHNVSLIFKKF